MKNQKRRKPAVLATAVALAVVMVIAATFAWFTAHSSVTNRLATKDGLANIDIQETFVEPDDWKPGQKITKEVGVVDTGNAPALARVYFKEFLKVYQKPYGENTIFDATKEAAGERPVIFDDTSYSTWVAYTGAGAAQADLGDLIITGIPSGVEAYVKYIPGTAGNPASYSFVFWAPISFEGKNVLQMVTYNKVWGNDTKTLALSNVKYQTCGAPVTAISDWTDSSDTPSFADIEKSVAETKLHTTAPTTGNYPNNIELNYANITLTPTPDKWYYNEDDGYFYFIGLVEPGTVTPSMLQSLFLNGAADSDYYGNMVYELTVEMDAVQHTIAAVNAEWPTVAANSDLATALYDLCEF